MKHIQKSLLLVTCVLLILAYMPITAFASTANVKDEWKDIYRQFLLKFKINTEQEGAEQSIALLDVNMDGTPELLMGAPMYLQEYYVYRIVKGKVLKCDSFSTEGPANQDEVQVTLYQNKETKTYQWVAQANTGLDDVGNHTYIFNSTEPRKNLFLYEYLGNKNKTVWKVNGKTTTKTKFYQQYNAAFANLVAQDYKVTQYVWDIYGTSSSRATIVDKMLQEYKPFVKQ